MNLGQIGEEEEEKESPAKMKLNKRIKQFDEGEEKAT